MCSARLRSVFTIALLITTSVLVVPWQDSAAKAQPIYQSFFKDASQAWRSNGELPAVSECQWNSGARCTSSGLLANGALIPFGPGNDLRRSHGGTSAAILSGKGDSSRLWWLWDYWLAMVPRATFVTWHCMAFFSICKPFVSRIFFKCFAAHQSEAPSTAWLKIQSAHSSRFTKRGLLRPNAAEIWELQSSLSPQNECQWGGATRKFNNLHGPERHECYR